VVGTAIAGLAEALNQLGLIPLFNWQFAPGWPFGITSDWLRVCVLALAGGLFLIIVNGMARQLYKRRLRVG